MQKAKKLATIGRDCVACGCCVKVCPRGASHIHFGVIAVVDIPIRTRKSTRYELKWEENWRKKRNRNLNFYKL